MDQQQDDQVRLEPQRVIERLRQQLAEAEMRSAQFGALADQLAEENAELRNQATAGAVDKVFSGGKD